MLLVDLHHPLLLVLGKIAVLFTMIEPGLLPVFEPKLPLGRTRIGAVGGDDGSRDVNSQVNNLLLRISFLGVRVAREDLLSRHPWSGCSCLPLQHLTWRRNNHHLVRVLLGRRRAFQVRSTATRRRGWRGASSSSLETFGWGRGPDTIVGLMTNMVVRSLLWDRFAVHDVSAIQKE